MNRKPELNVACSGCRVPVPEGNLRAGMFGRYCGRCTPSPIGAGSAGPAPLTPSDRERQATYDRLPDLDVERLRRAGDELRSLDEMSTRLQRMSIHEGGHAVVGFALGIPVQAIEVDLHGGIGFTERGKGGPLWTAHDAACWLFAGEAAERQKYGLSRGHSDDAEVLVGVAEVAAPGVIDQAQALAVDIVARNWRAVEAVASALVAARRLDAFDAYAILARYVRMDAQRSEERSAAPTVVPRRYSAEHEARLSRIAEEHGVTREQAQELFNQACRRRYGLDSRSQIRTYEFRGEVR